jgi:hypothetical protein
MRGLFRSALALFALALTMIGCNRSGSPGTSGGLSSDQGLVDAPYQATFRVPGMT